MTDSAGTWAMRLADSGFRSDFAFKNPTANLAPLGKVMTKSCLAQGALSK